MKPNLLKHLDGHFDLRGGSETDRAAAKEWISLFLHNAAVSFTSMCGIPPLQNLATASPAKVF